MKFKKEPAILVTSHGSLCHGLLNTVEMIYGELENVSAISLEPGDSIEAYGREIEAFIEANDGDAVILLDFVGGSPFNTTVKLCREHEICAIVGANFNMLAAAIDLRGEYDDASELAAAIEKTAAEGIRDLTPMLKNMHDMALNE